MSAHPVCRCGEAGGTAHCPMHGSQYPTRSVSLSQQPGKSFTDYLAEQRAADPDFDATMAEMRAVVEAEIARAEQQSPRVCPRCRQTPVTVRGQSTAVVDAGSGNASYSVRLALSCGCCVDAGDE